jgi:hypothetical protein
MLQRPALLIGSIALVAGLLSCSRQSNPTAPLGSAPQESGDGLLTIQNAKVVYSSSQRLRVTATVENHTDRLFYARLGDAYNSAAEQPTLWCAAGSNGFLEQWNPPAWQSMPRFFLFEGVRVVELRPHSTYTLQGGTSHSESGNRFARFADRISLRLRVQYFDDAALSPDQEHQDFSNNFVLERSPTR